MYLSDLRKRIDDIDEQITALFSQRMEFAEKIAEYKQENNMPILQSSREDEILDRISSLSPNKYQSGAKLLFTNIMDISKCLQSSAVNSEFIKDIPIVEDEPNLPKVACQGVQGAYSEAACDKLFPNAQKSFCESFEEVFAAVEEENVDFGILPIRNSTSGEVSQTYDLMVKHNFYIHKSVEIKVNHCLCAKQGVSFSEIERVYSHEQALKQCSAFLVQNPQLLPIAYSNTAAAAKLVASSDEPIAAICSQECAQIYGLEILQRGLVSEDDNYTRFICIKRELSVIKGADVISVSLSIPNSPAALYRLLTRFAVAGLNLSRIESKPIGNRNFDVIFYLDFIGTVADKKVLLLLSGLERELSYYKFLGNFLEVR